jgi:hypothetical protein
VNTVPQSHNRSDTWPPLARSHLAALREKKPARKSAQIRAVWPDIKAALDKGHSLKVVCECLEATGVAVTVPALAVYIGRIRKKDREIDRVPPPVSAVASKDSSATPGDRTDLKTTGNGTRHSTDPLANFRESGASDRRFDYRPELADPTKLI